jgi:hypothetical protein
MPQYAFFDRQLDLPAHLTLTWLQARWSGDRGSPVAWLEQASVCRMIVAELHKLQSRLQFAQQGNSHTSSTAYS